MTDYTDAATGIMIEDPGGSGKFTEVVLRPCVSVTHDSMRQLAIDLHKKANEFCFIANSCNFPIRHEPVCIVGEDQL